MNHGDQIFSINKYYLFKKTLIFVAQNISPFCISGFNETIHFWHTAVMDKCQRMEAKGSMFQ